MTIEHGARAKEQPLRIRVLRIPGLRIFQNWLSAEGFPTPLFVDLSLGGWRPRQAAVELATQLGIALPVPDDSGHGTAFDTERPSYADIIGSGVDAEARGDRSIIAAFHDAATITSSIASDPRPVFLFPPRFGLPWREENHWFVRFLARGLSGIDQFVTVVDQSSEQQQLPAGSWHVETTTLTGEGIPPPTEAGLSAFVPGLVPKGLLRLPGIGEPPEGLDLAHGLFLIAPEQRSDPRVVPRTTLDRFTGLMQGQPWERAFGQCFGNNLFVASLELTDLAWQAFAQGSLELALEFLERAVTCAKTPAEKAVCHARAQGIRIASHRFAEVAAVPEPARTLPPALRQFILQTKGWGLVMTGNPTAAEECFSVPLATLASKPTLDTEDLYLLNIHALSVLRQGRPEEALAIEHRIEAERENQPDPDHRLSYINHINLARLYRGRGELGPASRHYEEAFATTTGVRSASEALHWNVIQASMAAAAGDGAQADIAWLRAALHWLACPVPEALGQRVIQALLGHPPTPGEDRVDSVANALRSRLTANDRSCPVAAVHFAGIEDPAPRSIHQAVGAPGWSVFVSHDPPLGKADERESRLQLGSLVFARLRELADLPGPETPLTLVVDPRHGTEMAGNPRELLSAAVEHEAPEICWQQQHLSLDADQRARLICESTVALGPAVEKSSLADPVPYVLFRRYLPPRALDTGEVAILRAAQSANTVMEISRQLGQPWKVTLRSLEQLRRQRILTLELGEEACTLAGIRWPTNGI